MRYRDLRIGTKLGIGFGVILALFVIAGLSNYRSFDSIEGNSDNAQTANDLKTEMVKREVDHLKWAMKVQELFAEEGIEKLDVQLDPTQCGFGKWYYSEETQKLAAADPELARLLREIEAPHRELHESAAKIAQQWVAFDPELQMMLAERWQDHQEWAQGLASSILGRRVFDGQLDPEQCAFGKWHSTFETDSRELTSLLTLWTEPHRMLHQSAAKIVEAQRRGDWSGAQGVFARETTPALQQVHSAYVETDHWLSQMDEHQHRAHEIYANETQEHLAQVQGQLGSLVDHFNTNAADAGREVRGSISGATTALLVLSMVGIAIGIGAALVIARGISRPVGAMAAAAQAIAEGDVNQSIRVDSKDEVGVLGQAFNHLIDYMKHLAHAAERIAENDLTVKVQAKSNKDVLGNSFQTMATNLVGMVRQLKDNATQLVSAATEIASTSEQASRGAKDQAQQIGQLSTAVEEMSATIVESSKNAGEASDASKGAADTAGSGGQIVTETIQGMQRIYDTVRASAESIGKLAGSADQIGQIVGVIDDIADQTNLLALNAAIEAARAGEQGRGFAVVADEVRKLAERTGKATGEITGMIKGIQSDTREAVQSMESGIVEVDKGRGLADQAGNSLNEIVTMSQRVMDMIRQIATATEQQSAAAEQISKNIENVSTIVKESATGAEQSAAAAEELNRQAEGLQNMVAQFKID